MACPAPLSLSALFSCDGSITEPGTWAWRSYWWPACPCRITMPCLQPAHFSHGSLEWNSGPHAWGNNHTPNEPSIPLALSTDDSEECLTQLLWGLSFLKTKENQLLLNGRVHPHKCPHLASEVWEPTQSISSEAITNIRQHWTYNAAAGSFGENQTAIWRNSWNGTKE